MAKSTSGKWVSRVGASGGGRTYRRTRPSNFYAALVVIVILGFASVVYSRYEYQNPSPGTSATPPAVGTTWYAALAVDDCGTFLPSLSPDPTVAKGFIVQSGGVIKVSPISSADSGNNATLAQFAREYGGVTLNSTSVTVPVSLAKGSSTTTLTNGQHCAPASKYAGKVGQVTYAYWSSLSQKAPKLTTDPSTIKFSQYLRVTIGFLPSGVTPAAPPKATVDAMVAAAVTPSTTTTVAPVTTTTAPTTSTTAGSTSSTTSSTSTTTTTAPKG